MANNLARLNSSIQKVQLSKLRVSPAAQREMNESRVAHLVAEFDPEMLGLPVVSNRNGHFYTIDGQHRVEATKRWLGDGWEKQNIDCRVYLGMTEREEAAMFLELNDVLSVTAFDKFKVAVTSNSSDETAVKKAVESVGLRIAREKKDNSVACVGTLLKVYRRADAKTLGRALAITNNSFGAPGMTNHVIDGIARVCERYNGELQDEKAIESLTQLRGGVGALLTKAGLLRQQTAQSMSQCVGAAVVDVVNRGRGGKKLPAWWKETEA
ncbi:MAG: DUF6551 family protein [Rhodocyclaceae bacterium]